MDLFKQTYRDGKILEQEKHGTVVCIPKKHRPSTPADYRPITLLNTDYNILARIIAVSSKATFVRTVTPEAVLWVGR